MRDLIIAILLAGTAGSAVFFWPSGSSAASYSLTVREAKSRLAAADIRRGKAPFGTMDVLITSPEPDVLKYSAAGTFAALECTATFVPADETSVSVTTDCSGSALVDGAAAPAASELNKLAFAEYVDSALDGRPFDEEKFRAQSAGAVLRNLPQMQKNALEMSREMARIEAEAERAEASAEAAEGGWGDDTQPPFDFGE